MTSKPWGQRVTSPHNFTQNKIMLTKTVKSISPFLHASRHHLHHTRWQRIMPHSFIIPPWCLARLLINRSIIHRSIFPYYINNNNNNNNNTKINKKWWSIHCESHIYIYIYIYIYMPWKNAFSFLFSRTSIRILPYLGENYQTEWLVFASLA